MGGGNNIDKCTIGKYKSSMFFYMSLQCKERSSRFADCVPKIKGDGSCTERHSLFSPSPSLRTPLYGILSTGAWNILGLDHELHDLEFCGRYMENHNFQRFCYTAELALFPAPL